MISNIDDGYEINNITRSKHFPPLPPHTRTRTFTHTWTTTLMSSLGEPQDYIDVLTPIEELFFFATIIAQRNRETVTFAGDSVTIVARKTF